MLGMDGFLEIFNHHKKDLSTIYGEFREYKSFRPIMELEFERWTSTDAAQVPFSSAPLLLCSLRSLLLCSLLSASLLLCSSTPLLLCFLYSAF
jgi:hypothetical protein